MMFPPQSQSQKLLWIFRFSGVRAWNLEHKIWMWIFFPRTCPKRNQHNLIWTFILEQRFWLKTSEIKFMFVRATDRRDKYTPWLCADDRVLPMHRNYCWRRKPNQQSYWDSRDEKHQIVLIWLVACGKPSTKLPRGGLLSRWTFMRSQHYKSYHKVLLLMRQQ